MPIGNATAMNLAAPLFMTVKTRPSGPAAASKKKGPSRSWGPGWAMNSARHGTFEECTANGLNGRASLPAYSPWDASVGQKPIAEQKLVSG